MPTLESKVKVIYIQMVTQTPISFLWPRVFIVSTITDYGVLIKMEALYFITDMALVWSIRSMSRIIKSCLKALNARTPLSFVHGGCPYLAQ